MKDDQYQRKIIADLDAHRVKYIVWDPQSIYFQIDGFSNELRAPPCSSTCARITSTMQRWMVSSC